MSKHHRTQDNGRAVRIQPMPQPVGHAHGGYARRITLDQFNALVRRPAAPVVGER